MISSTVKIGIATALTTNIEKTVKINPFFVHIVST